MNDKLANYFKNFNERLTDDLGSRFDYPKLLSYGKKNRAAITLVDDTLNLPWLDEVEEIVEKIKTIVNNVNPNIDPEAEFENGQFDTFEDRYIVFLIDQLAKLLAVTSSHLASSTKKLSDYYINHRIPLGEMRKLNGINILNSRNSLFLKEERKLVTMREILGRLMDTNYYINLKKSVRFDEGCVCINSVLANEPLYSECYDFYKRLEELLSAHYDLPEPVRNIDYQNFAFLSLLLAFDERGFILSGAS
ncbi:MAG: hypothetical protein J5880_03800, partial [Bacilli bacterium]|nr:hypothetical protein [Bacilli bacterium]MBO4682889.1 hypothetical protein [Bacilli bacterium]